MILVLNAGSSSLKYRLFDMKPDAGKASGVIERIGAPDSIHTYHVHTNGQTRSVAQSCEIKDHRSGMHSAAQKLTDPVNGVLESLSQIKAIGHRVVQGGEEFSAAVRVDDAVKQVIRDHIPLAPLHNPSNLTGIEEAQVLFPGIPNIAVFDTQFHQSMPPRAFRYAVPDRYYTTHRVRRYGFHGTSHKHVSEQAATLMGKDIKEINLITIHLGNGCSICAVEKGQSIDTSMGMTPLAGVMMGTRSGDIDPAIMPYIAREEGVDMVHLETVLNRESGFFGICGQNDMRDVHEAANGGSKKAELAIDMAGYQIKKFIGAYAAALGRVDAVVFTAGIGENDPVIREKSCENLSSLGIRIDHKKNVLKNKTAFSFHAQKSAVQLWMIPTNEELQIAKEVVWVLKRPDHRDKNGCTNNNQKI